MIATREYMIRPSQLALSWLLHQGEDIFPSPGTRKVERIDENAQALDIELAATALKRIDEIAQVGMAEGETLL